METKTVAILLIAALAVTMPAGVLSQTANTAEKDFRTEPETRAGFANGDFVLKFLTKMPSPAGIVQPAFVNDNPVLGTLPGLGISQQLVTVKACGQNTLHIHPRATELSFVIKGTFLVGVVDENNGKGLLALNNVTAGQSFLVPQGLLHSEQNQGCEDAQFIANFPNRDPGTLSVAQRLFKFLPDDILRATLNTNTRDYKGLQTRVAANVNPQFDPNCLKRCGLGQNGRRL